MAYSIRTERIRSRRQYQSLDLRYYECAVLTALASFSARTVFRFRFFLIGAAGVEAPEATLDFFFSESDTSQSSYSAMSMIRGFQPTRLKRISLMLANEARGDT